MRTLFVFTFYTQIQSFARSFLGHSRNTSNSAKDTSDEDEQCDEQLDDTPPIDVEYVYVEFNCA